MRFSSRIALTCSLLTLLGAPLASAADGGDAQSLNAGALVAMDSGRWQEALGLLERCVQDYDSAAYQRFGSSFGVSWYRKGICELKLQKWQDAARSFQKCYLDYPNQASDGGNPYHKQALLRWGEALQGGGEPAEAIRLYNKFLAERDKTEDGFQPASFYLGIALCQFKVGNVPEGVIAFETAIRNRSFYNTPDHGIAAAFQALVDAALLKKDEKLVTGFISRNRGSLLVSPAEMESCADLFLSLGSVTSAAGMPAASIALYGLVPGTDEMIEDLRTRLERPADLDSERLARFRSALDRLEEQRRSDTSADVTRLAATAMLLEQTGDVRGAYSCYQLLENFHARSPQREEHLFQLIRLAIVCGDTMKADHYEAAFASAFPQSKKGAEAKRIMLGALFRGGEYEACARAASPVVKGTAEGGRDHEAALYYLAASDFYLGKGEEAASLIERHLSLYPQSEYRQAARWFQASGRVRQGKLGEAAALLDRFLADYPDPAVNGYLPYALFERASCHVAEKQWQEALEKLDRLQQAFSEAEVMDSGHALRGQVLVALHRPQEAVDAYRKSLAFARAHGHSPVAAEALMHLVSLLGDGKGKPEQAREVTGYIDLFWKEFAGEGGLACRFAVVAAEPLARAGRTEEALERLAKVISGPKSPGEDRTDAAWAYAQLFLRKHTPDELKGRILSFPGMSAEDRSSQALIRGIAIMVLDDPARRETPDWKGKADPVISALYQDLKGNFPPEAYTTPLLIRMGDHLRLTTSAPRQALPYYEEALKRTDHDYRARALLGKAAVLAGGSSADRVQAQETLSQEKGLFASLSPEEQGIWRQIETLAAGGSISGTEAPR